MSVAVAVAAGIGVVVGAFAVVVYVAYKAKGHVLVSHRRDVDASTPG